MATLYPADHRDPSLAGKRPPPHPTPFPAYVPAEAHPRPTPGQPYAMQEYYAK